MNASGKIKWVDNSGNKHIAYFYAHDDEWAKTNNLFWRIEFVGPGSKEYRYARVAKTRTYVCVDESSDGTPIIETWITKVEWY